MSRPNATLNIALFMVSGVEIGFARERQILLRHKFTADYSEIFHIVSNHGRCILMQLIQIT